MTQSTEQERAEFERVALNEGWARRDPQYGLVFWDHRPKDLAWKAWQAARRAQVVPDGWRLVPVTPTNEMESAGGDAINDPDLSTSLCECASVTWHAMLAAAPKPPEVNA